MVCDSILTVIVPESAAWLTILETALLSTLWILFRFDTIAGVAFQRRSIHGSGTRSWIVDRNQRNS